MSNTLQWVGIDVNPVLYVVNMFDHLNDYYILYVTPVLQSYNVPPTEPFTVKAGWAIGIHYKTASNKRGVISEENSKASKSHKRLFKDELSPTIFKKLDESDSELTVGGTFQMSHVKKVTRALPAIAAYMKGKHTQMQYNKYFQILAIMYPNVM